ncbi:MAG TPA: type II secretion system protein [Patescibacteria group bacterium]|nr:type II secretion system protein [Patescibacteria group bacterium]
MLKIKHTKGFTLIELLIVVSIIGILTAFFVNTSTINIKRSRDARRKTDLSAIQSAIETYKADCNVYPTSMNFGSTLTGDGSTANCLSTNKYMTLVPQDPNSESSYVYWSDGTTYDICSTLEVTDNSMAVTCGSGAGATTNCGSSTCYYEVTNP